MKALKLIYDKICAGEVFGTIDQHRLGGTYFWEVLWIGTNRNQTKYIGFRHAGSSATKCSIKELKWILGNIFEITPEQFLFDYTTYSKWAKIDEAYEAA